MFHRPKGPVSSTFPWLTLLSALFFLSAGCARIPVAKQGLVAKPNMVFADTAVFGDRSSLQGQIEPGAAATGGAQAAGCTSCK